MDRETQLRSPGILPKGRLLKLLVLPAVASTRLRPFVKAHWFAISAGLCDVAFIITITVAILVFIFHRLVAIATVG